jgi:hypothetical protein
MDLVQLQAFSIRIGNNKVGQYRATVIVMIRYNLYILFNIYKYMVTITGIIKYQDIAVGVWTLISDSGETYELYKPSENLRQEGLKVTVQGKIRDDIMSMAMVGKILEIISVA